MLVTNGQEIFARSLIGFSEEVGELGFNAHVGDGLVTTGKFFA